MTYVICGAGGALIGGGLALLNGGNPGPAMIVSGLVLAIGGLGIAAGRYRR